MDSNVTPSIANAGERPAAGKVFLVGAGPGDPGLITLRGWECLRQADLVLYDGLVNPDLLRHTTAAAQRTCRSEGPEGRRVPQDEINRQLIAAARQGKTVVRLKGGDPFIFGRGTEEATALSEAGIAFEVVPGITAATAAAVYSGLSLTHRDFASAVAFVTGHEDPQKETSRLDYQALACFPGTLVFYMGLHRIAQISAELISHGKPPHTPTLVVSRATTPRQKTVSAPLEEIAAAAHAAALHAPSLLIIGDVVRVREHATWFEQRPLFGKTIGITRPEEQADDALALAYRLGAQPILLPTIEIAPPDQWTAVDAALARLREFDWIVFTSANGVRGLLGRLWDAGGDDRRIGKAKLAAIGTATADALREFSLRADLVPAEFRAEALAAALAPLAVGKTVLWARADRGRDVLPMELTRAGATVEQVVVYRNRDVESWPADVMNRLDRGELDWIGLSSPSIARNLARLLSPTALQQLGSRTHLVSISPVTTAAAREAGLPIAAEAETFTWAGIFQAIVRAEAPSSVSVRKA
ncbi:MAG: uroporphyrinogen-III C-methyltransferase [Planctomycetaceae bacterium]